MRKIMKRGFCLFLVAVLLAGLVPCAFADEAKTSEEVEASEAATEAAEETTAPPETVAPSESTEPPSETIEPPEATETTESETEVTEPKADPVEDAPEDAVEDDRLPGCQKPREQTAGRCPVKEACMAEVQHLIQVSDYEQRLMVNGLNAFRNDLIRDGKPTEDINALLMKVIDAPEKKPKRKFDRER